MESKIYVQETFADIDDEFCDDDSIVEETIIVVDSRSLERWLSMTMQLEIALSLRKQLLWTMRNLYLRWSPEGWSAQTMELSSPRWTPLRIQLKLMKMRKMVMGFGE